MGPMCWHQEGDNKGWTPLWWLTLLGNTDTYKGLCWALSLREIRQHGRCNDVASMPALGWR